MWSHHSSQTASGSVLVRRPLSRHWSQSQGHKLQQPIRISRRQIASRVAADSAPPVTEQVGLDAQVAVVLGTQWGDEGKGKLVDILAQQYEVVARAQVLLISVHANLQSSRRVMVRVLIISASSRIELRQGHVWLHTYTA